MASGASGVILSLALYFLTVNYTKTLHSANSVNIRPAMDTIDPSRLLLHDIASLHNITCEAECHQLLIVPIHLYSASNHLTRKQGACYSQNPKFSTFLLLCMLACGDIQPNPGPIPSKRLPKNPCVRCDRNITSRSKAVDCDDCGRWTHVKCTYSMTMKIYNQLVKEDCEFPFVCSSCSIQSLPFTDMTGDSEEFMGKDQHDTWSTTKPSEADEANFDFCKQRGLHFVHLNTRSLIPKLSELRLIAFKTKAAVIALTETWLDSSVSDSEISIEGYSVYRHDRDRHGGGVCLYVSNSIAVNYRPDLIDARLEALWVELLLPKTKPIHVGVCYRPPKDSTFLSLFEGIIAKLRSDCELIILGDFNINYCIRSGSLFDKYEHILQMFAFKQLIDTPTRVTSACSSILDHIICNFKNKISQSGTVSVGLSDHFLTYCTRKISKGQIRHHNTIKLRSMKNFTKEKLLSAIDIADWSGVFCSDVDRAWCEFKNVFSSIIDQISPIKEVRLKIRTEPWMNSEILDLIRLRDQLLHQFKREQKQDLYSDYCKMRNKVQREVKKAKSNYFQVKIEENKNYPKKLWEHLKALGYSSKTKDHSQVVLNIDDELCFNASRIANYVNKFFTSVAGTLVGNLPPPSGKFDTSSEAFKGYYGKLGVTHDSFKLVTVSVDFVFKELRSLNPNKSTGLDEIPAKFLREGADALKDKLTHIINLSIHTNTVPTDFKSARVRPLFKKNSRLDVGNYRPVSILCVVSKLLEKAVYHQLESYLCENNILYNFQSGFRGAYSTDTCLVHLTDYIRNEISIGNYTGMVLLDLQKAFDTVDHVILLEKLQAMGVSSVDWFRSYLTGRRQIVNINKVDSGPLNITCGVPQGSILGPLLFLCYVNDMAISVRCKLLLYADDSILLVSGKDLQCIADSLGVELESCRKWLVDNKLSLHLGKTESILFGSKRKLNKAGIFSVTCNGETIQSSKSANYLGVILDASLTSDSIAENVLKKAGARLKFLYRQARFLNEKTRKTLCMALIMCHFDYSSSSWFSSTSSHYKNKLQVMQNKVVRFILNKGPRAHIGQEELNRVGFLDVEDRVKQLKLGLVFKIFHGRCPDYLKVDFKRVSSVHNYSTRGSLYNFKVPRVNGQAQHTFYSTAINLWNSLPTHIKQLNEISVFKARVKNYLATIKAGL